MPVTIQLRGGNIAVLHEETAGRPFILIDLDLTHQIWRRQYNYKQIKIDNDQYERGERVGAGIIPAMPIISVDDNVPWLDKLILIYKRLPAVSIGLSGGRHRTDYFYRAGARVFPVHFNSEKVRQSIARYLLASQELVAEFIVNNV